MKLSAVLIKTENGFTSWLTMIPDIKVSGETMEDVRYKLDNKLQEFLTDVQTIKLDDYVFIESGVKKLNHG